MLRLLIYGNENDNGYDKHLRSRTELMMIITWRILKRGSKIAKDDVTAKIEEVRQGENGKRSKVTVVHKPLFYDTREIS